MVSDFLKRWERKSEEDFHILFTKKSPCLNDWANVLFPEKSHESLHVLFTGIGFYAFICRAHLGLELRKIRFCNLDTCGLDFIQIRGC
ncbi:hypothetical protein THS27_22965 [Thalassospira sp. MCCC 1A01428]|nr:hypothetical protein THS27_22965 [Thalassospira sp. MCCC 1A01428]